MAEEFLDAAEVCTGIEHVGGEAVAELVGADVKGDGAECEIFLEHLIDGLLGDACAAGAAEEWAGGDGGFLAVFLDGVDGDAADGDDALFPAFSGDSDDFLGEIYVWEVEAEELGDAEAGGVEEL